MLNWLAPGINSRNYWSNKIIRQGHSGLKITRLVKITLITAAVILSTIAWNAVTIYRFSLEDQTHKADCAIVAGAGIAGRLPSPVFKARLDHAIWLYQQGFVKSLILTGGMSPAATASDASIARQYVLTQGVPASALFIEEQSQVTRENMRNAREIMARQKLHTALLVSDPLHMLRLKLIARDNGIDGSSSPALQTRYQSWSTQLPFLLRESFYYTGYQIMRYLPR